MRVADRTARAALRRYSYRTDCRSLLDPWLDRLWYRPVLALVPRSVPANALTLLAFGLVLAACGACLAAVGHPEREVLLVAAGLAFWGYHTLDNVDGPHARRTGTSGPLGELLDHGLDAFVAFLVPLCLALAMSLSPAWTLALASMAAVGFWTTMWEVHRTGVMTTGRLSDVEAALATAALLVVAGIVGRGPLTAPVAAGWPSAVQLLVALTVAGFSWQAVSALRRAPPGALVLPLVQVLGTQALLLLWVPLGGAAVPAPAVAALLGLAAARATQRLLLDRLLGVSPPRADALTPALAAAGVLLLTALRADPYWPPRLVWAAAALLAIVQTGAFVRDLRLVRRLLAF